MCGQHVVQYGLQALDGRAKRVGQQGFIRPLAEENAAEIRAAVDTLCSPVIAELTALATHHRLGQIAAKLESLSPFKTT